MKYLTLILLIFLTSCTDKVESSFLAGCNKMYQHFNKERISKGWKPIDDSLSCENRYNERIKEKPYYKTLTKKEPKMIEMAGCGFAVSSYISNYYDDFSPLKLQLYMASQQGDDSEIAKIADKFCVNVGLSMEQVKKETDRLPASK